MNLTRTDISILIDLINDVLDQHFINESEIGPDYEDGGETKILEQLKDKLLVMETRLERHK